MSDDQRESGMFVNRCDKDGGTAIIDKDNIHNSKPPDANNTLGISSDLINLMPFKFAKTATTDDIANVDTDLIDIDSFKYLNKALFHFIKNFDC